MPGRSACTTREPHCGVEPGRPASVETGSADRRFKVSHAHLRSALGTRRLTQPNRGARGQAGRFPATDCPRYVHLPSDAAARAVPWVTRRIRFCSERLPARLLALPILRRKASSTNRLSRETRIALSSQTFVTRTEQTRGLRRPTRMWFVPGPRRSCLYAAPYAQTCQPSRAVAGKGMYAAGYCVERSPPRRLSVAGVVPAAIHAVRLQREAKQTRCFEYATAYGAPPPDTRKRSFTARCASTSRGQAAAADTSPSRGDVAPGRPPRDTLATCG